MKRDLLTIAALNAAVWLAVVVGIGLALKGCGA